MRFVEPPIWPVKVLPKTYVCLLSLYNSIKIFNSNINGIKGIKINKNINFTTGIGNKATPLLYKFIFVFKTVLIERLNPITRYMSKRGN